MKAWQLIATMLKKAIIESYVAGVNSYIKEVLKKNPAVIATTQNKKYKSKNSLVKPKKKLGQFSYNYHQIAIANKIAVTGTNGKTSVANFTRQIWECLGKKAVNIGTAGVEGAVSINLSHTTPEPTLLHKILYEIEANGVTHASMEASSHGLDQKRLDGVYLTAAAFTNFHMIIWIITRI